MPGFNEIEVIFKQLENEKQNENDELGYDHDSSLDAYSDDRSDSGLIWVNSKKKLETQVKNDGAAVQLAQIVGVQPVRAAAANEPAQDDPKGGKKRIVKDLEK